MNEYGELAKKRVPHSDVVDLTATNSTSNCSMVDLTVNIPNPNSSTDLTRPSSPEIMVASVLSADDIINNKFIDAQKTGRIISLE